MQRRWSGAEGLLGSVGRESTATRWKGPIAARRRNAPCKRHSDDPGCGTDRAKHMKVGPLKVSQPDSDDFVDDMPRHSLEKITKAKRVCLRPLIDVGGVDVVRGSPRPKRHIQATSAMKSP
ncbi:UDP-N-acetylmuramoyl-L-alanyl-D-glutamate--2,6-diaminopimelate ligase [Striga asiatica]|uniref:UDP-N-acetylmuramoyl-L-alanyl-D-glutamate--2,6-diaminopimelate ligase n=1 Tax=Striga asiatica TaxID=4170 RepID=A0A5A7NYF9_STRAF|nr:UDP-N-acetylmuramoyl-L-alanyl-D-glutamate--2,6-diaminopimelate ligase [Striga asiatica]